jgi:hypothetical protein
MKFTTIKTGICHPRKNRFPFPCGERGKLGGNVESMNFRFLTGTVRVPVEEINISC